MQAPDPPELERVELDPKETALLVLDVQNRNCNEERRPRCVATLPRIRKLLEAARSSGVQIVYSLTRGADRSDVREEVAPMEGEGIVSSSVDKFQGTDLEGILAAGDIKTVIVVGTSAHGAVLHTATGAALRDLRVVVPVDCISSSDRYPEQYTVWHLANAPGSRRHVLLSRSDLIHM